MNGAEAIVTWMCITFAFIGGVISGANVERKALEYEKRNREIRARKRRENTSEGINE